MFKKAFKPFSEPSILLFIGLTIAIVAKAFADVIDLSFIEENHFLQSLVYYTEKVVLFVFCLTAAIFLITLIVSYVFPAEKVDKEWWERRPAKQKKPNTLLKKMNDLWLYVFIISLYVFPYSLFLMFCMYAHINALALLVVYLLFQFYFQKREKAIFRPKA